MERTKKTESKTRQTPVKPQAAPSEKNEFLEGIGRRKTATARVRISKASARTVTVNEKTLAEHFQNPLYEELAISPLEKLSLKQNFAISAVIHGGGKHAQADALRHGLARALIEFDETLRGELKTFGFLTRDPRMKERKKFGLKKARRARQWRKR